MVSLLKTFAKGILYVLGLPFFILALLIFGVIGLFAFLFQVIKSIIFFFTGQKFFPELPEDKELRLLKENATSSPLYTSEKDETPDIISHYEEEVSPNEEIVKEETINQEVATPSSVEEACFKPSFNDTTKEEIIEEDIHEEGLNDLLDNDEVEDSLTRNILMGDEEDTILETTKEKESEEDLVEELETYVPRSSNYEAQIDDDDTDIGVDIDYDVR